MIEICPHCEKRRELQRKFVEVVRQAKAYKIANNLRVILICKNIETNEFLFCEEGDVRLDVTIKEIERLIL